MGIFREYDVRGLYPSEVSEQIAYNIGRALVVYLGAKEIVVARDCRLGSPSMAKAVIEGICDQGASVIDVGLASTPLFYFCIGFLKPEGGIMVTASHCPKEFNGFKICKQGPVSLSLGLGFPEIQKMVDGGIFPQPISKGTIKEIDMLNKYADHVLTFAKDIKPLKVVIDAGNGMGGLVCPEVLSKLPVISVPIWFDLDGSFPNRNPNPMILENLKTVCDRVKKEKADLGVIFDGDADRIIFIDERGEFIPGDFTTALIAEYLSSQKKHLTVLYDLRSSRILKEHLQSLGISSFRTMVGHSHVKSAMRKYDADFAGELSGHFYFKENYFSDSSMIAFAMILSILSRTGKSLSSLIKPFRKYYSTFEVNFSVMSIEGVLKEIKKVFKDGKQDELDGITVEYPDWWFNVRPSKNDPVLRMVLEAYSGELLKEKRAQVERVIQKFVVPAC